MAVGATRPVPRRVATLVGSVRRELVNLAVYAGFRLAMAIIASLPSRVARRAGELGGVAAFHLARGRRRMTIRHARRLGAADPVDHARSVFACYGRYWAEAFWVRPKRLAEMGAQIEVEGLHHVKAALAEGIGFIAAVPHLGNWEIAGTVAIREGIPVTAVAEDLANRRIRDWFVELRNRLGFGIVLASRNGTSVMRKLEAVIAANGGVALLCDRDLSGRGIPVRFFGEETTFPGGPASLAVRTGAPVIPIAVYFQEGGGHRVVIHPPLDLPSEGERKERMRQITQLVATALEELIMVAPEQWHLLQPNWPSDQEAEGAREGADHR